MVAPYKKKRHFEMDSQDRRRVNHMDLEGAERIRAKKEIRHGLRDAEDESDRRIQEDLDWEEEMNRAWECYLREKADPNYRCTCFDDKENVGE